MNCAIRPIELPLVPVAPAASAIALLTARSSSIRRIGWPARSALFTRAGGIDDQIAFPEFFPVQTLDGLLDLAARLPGILVYHLPHLVDDVIAPALVQGTEAGARDPIAAWATMTGAKPASSSGDPGLTARVSRAGPGEAVP